jgi:hypothetical protein
MQEEEWLTDQCGNSMQTNTQVSASRWKPPPTDYYKINVDASFHASTNQGGWGFVAREWEGNFLEGGAGNIPRAASAPCMLNHWEL